MRRVSGLIGLTVVVIALAAPSSARAEGFVTPWFGVNFGNDPADGRSAFGFGASYMGAGVIGAEFDFGYSPSFFGTENDFGHNNVLTAMGNLIVGIPIGGTSGGGIRPYVTGGAGLIRSKIAGLFDDGPSNNDWGINVGGGVMGYFNDHVGIRGDIRYFRNLNNDFIDNPLNLDFGGFHFWRGYFGVVFR
jgi:hypothetical protein